ncbi:MAG TPA: phenylalanine--tRNA ligase subunit beta [Sphingobacteriaceae bacterium]|nr:phenylalanine--tRNA ligase subunit beta [Sphingobacteriaceae bacterium]
MRVPLSWLKEFVAVDLDGRELADRLTNLGLEVEQVIRPQGEARGLVIGRIQSVEPHPGADNLLVCRVDVGHRVLTVVTGAANPRPQAWVVAAPPGSRLPGGQELAVRSIRGIDSEGMLCATWELGLPSAARTDEERLAEGLLILPDGDGLRPGMDALPVLGLDEEVLELSLTPNYAVHCQSIVGVAREVAALLEIPLRLPDPRAGLPLGAAQAAAAVQGGEEAGGAGGRAEPWARVTVEEPDLCSRYIARGVTGIRLGPSPLLIQQRLQLCGMRPINNVVDVTNYVMLETGQPLHAFDLAKLAGRHIVVRNAREGESVVTLDGVERNLTTGDLVIADAQRPQALAGVMGGALSEVGPDTTAILLEAAIFERSTVFRASRRLGLRTEASARFDKGVDPEAVDAASLRAAVMIAQLAGGSLIPESIDVGAPPPRRVITMRPRRVRSLLVPERAAGRDDAPDLADDVITGHLERLGFQVEPDPEAGAGEERYRVTVPSYRADVTGEADLAEEVGRLLGYDRIPALLPLSAMAGGARSPRQQGLLTVRRLMAAAGYHEVVTWSFARADLAGRLRLPHDHPQHRALAIANPMSEDQARLRTTLLGGLLDTAAYNLRHQNEDLTLFEVGTVYLPGPSAGELPLEKAYLGLLARGVPHRDHWQGSGPAVDFFAVKGVLEHVARRLATPLDFAGTDLPFLQPGQAAQLACAGAPAGWLGKLHPDIAAQWDLPEDIFVAEVDLDVLLAARQESVRFQPLPRFPAVQRDVSVVVPEDLPVARIQEVITAAGGSLLEHVSVFDEYRGSQVPDGCRSLAFALTYRSRERTLTDAEVDQVHEGVREALVQQLGAALR